MKNLTSLIKFILSDLELRGWTVRLRPVKSIKYGKDTFKGYCDSDKKIIEIAAEADHWWMLLAHEWAHSCQEHTKEVEWAYTYPCKKKRNKDKMLEATRIIQGIELDAEKRACKLVKEFKINLPENYIQKANAYILSYEAGRRLDKWDMKASPSGEYEIYSKMPKRFVSLKTLGKLEASLEDLYKERIFK